MVSQLDYSDRTANPPPQKKIKFSTEAWAQHGSKSTDLQHESYRRLINMSIHQPFVITWAYLSCFTVSIQCDSNVVLEMDGRLNSPTSDKSSDSAKSVVVEQLPKMCIIS